MLTSAAAGMLACFTSSHSHVSEIWRVLNSIAHLLSIMHQGAHTLEQCLPGSLEIPYSGQPSSDAKGQNRTLFRQKLSLFTTRNFPGYNSALQTLTVKYIAPPPPPAVPTRACPNMATPVSTLLGLFWNHCFAVPFHTGDKQQISGMLLPHPNPNPPSARDRYTAALTGNKTAQNPCFPAVNRRSNGECGL